MGMWKAFSSGRRSSGRLKLKEYDHSVGFTLRTEDQFTLAVPNQHQPEMKIAGVDIPIAYSFSYTDNGVDASTVSSITTNSTDISSSSSDSWPTSAEESNKELKSETQETEQSGYLASFYNLLPCWYEVPTNACTCTNDWSSDAKSKTPSDQSEPAPVETSEVSVEKNDTPVENKNKYVQINNKNKMNHEDTSEDDDDNDNATPVPSAPACNVFEACFFPNYEMDRYTIMNEGKTKAAVALSKKDKREQKRVDRLKKREERRNARKMRRGKKENVEIHLVEPPQRKEPPSPLKSLFSQPEPESPTRDNKKSGRWSLHRRLTRKTRNRSQIEAQ